MTMFGYFILLSFLFFHLPLCHSLTLLPEFDEDDIKCLNQTKAELTDPNQSLFTWRFGNNSQGFICNFVGIQCWHNDDGKVQIVNLPGMELSGYFPNGLKYCGSMTNLDLSSNNLSGTIPKDLCKWLPFLVQIDLSSNHFTGSIPPELANCTYLNVLRLNDNQLNGSIPWELTRLERLNDFNFRNNKLTGPIPAKWSANSSDLFEGNAGLCSKPLSRECGGPNSVNPVVVAAFVLYGIVIVIWSVLCIRGWISRQASRGTPLPPFRQPLDHVKIRRSKKVCLFEKPIKKMRVGDLADATHNFSEDNIIWSDSTGVFYKAELPDGSLLTVKRLRTSEQSEKEFKWEMKTLGHLRHRNLLPLLGYCIADAQERLLVYKYTARGTLLNCFHGLYRDRNELDWPTKLKICIGISRGLAWLHHICNPHIIHRNICSGVIYVDDDYEPRISGFGLARFSSDEGETSFFSQQDLVNDFQYDAPEQGRNIPCLPTLNGDVYSFGVVVLEIITGLKPDDVLMEKQSGMELTLIEWIRGNSKRAERVVEKYIEENGVFSEEEKSMVEELMEMGFRCVRYKAEERPSMYQAYQSLTKTGEKYGIWDNEVEKPHSVRSSMEISTVFNQGREKARYIEWRRFIPNFSE
ncbi:inactive LRR receptor-like serine/threonine-protein kinase BIR2 [Cryptomeria japonica]|uniref:inactive LRR receptor-like serine/threonine-protein kinase BIR2 n=1 Tax=Cryptomeria japonica TaxID=3369 RepID=UPI0027DAB37B|nr:inactive LRR receptor-like serine/threonine-protein kinase BIR2 [Cryptomeria japonica]